VRQYRRTTKLLQMNNLFIYLDFAHIGESQIIIRPKGMSDDDFISLIKTSKLIASGKKTKAGREYINFAPVVVKDVQLSFVSLASLIA